MGVGVGSTSAAGRKNLAIRRAVILLSLLFMNSASGETLSGPVIEAGSVARPLRLVARESTSEFATLELTRAAYREFQEATGSLVIAFPLDIHRFVTLELERFSVFGQSSRWLTVTASGVEDRPTPSLVMFRGKVRDQVQSTAYLSFSERGGGYGRVRLENGESYVLVGAASLRKDAFVFTVQRESLGGVPDFPIFCGTPPPAQRQPGEPPSVPSAPYVGSPRVAQVAIDADEAFVGLFGDVASAEDYIAQLLGAVSDIYIRDLNVKLLLTFVRTWPSGGEPFGAEDLVGFANHWILNEDMTGLNLVHMLSGRRGLPYGGIAYLGGTCSGGTFGINGYLNGSMPSPFGRPHLGNWDVVVVAHEMGHNMGTFHTHDGYTPPIDDCAFGVPDRGTIMSYCHINPGGLLNTNLRFHSRVQDVIAAEVAAEDCLWFDCNDNNVSDDADIAMGTSSDTNTNSIPDECEDCNGNGTLDSEDISDGAADVDGNGIPDACEVNCNANIWPDVFETAIGLAPDQNGNRVPDGCEADCNGNAIADFVEIDNGTLTDLDRNEVPDSCQDCDSNAVTDWIDLDRQFNVYLVDLGGYVREYLGISGVPIQNLGASALSGPTDAVFGIDGQLYVASFGTGEIIRINVDDGSHSVFVSAGAGGLGSPSALTTRPGGNLLVASNTTNEVLEFDAASGAPVGTFVAAGAGGLAGPYGLEIGPNGNLFVASSNHAVLEYSGADGSFVGTFVSPGSGGLFQPRGIAFKPNGNLLVASFGNDSVLEYDGAGNTLGTFNDLVIPTGAWGVRIGPNGNVFVARHTGTLRVLEYDLDTGRYVRSYLRGDSGMTAPTGFAFRPASDQDCNGNNRLDACDIDAWYSLDLDDNGIPDECESVCTVANQPSANVQAVAMNRYVSFVPNNPGTITAIRVTLQQLPAPYDSWNGQSLWVGEPRQVCENSGQGLEVSPPDCGPAPGIDRRWYWAAPLVCARPVAHFADWSALGSHCVGGTNDGGMCSSGGDCPGGSCGGSAAVHVYHEGIVPSLKVLGEPAFALEAAYAIQAVAAQCSLNSEDSFSTSLLVKQAAWGDVVSTVGDCPNGAPNLTIDVLGDIVSLLNKFSNLPCAVTKARSDLLPENLNFKVDILDAVAALGGFRGGNYFPAPSAANSCP